MSTSLPPLLPPNSRPAPPPLPPPKKNLPPPKKKQKQVGIPTMAESLDKLQRAVILKKNVSPDLRFTDKQALMLAGFTPDLAENQTIIMRFRRIFAKKQEEEEELAEARRSLWAGCIPAAATTNARTAAAPKAAKRAATGTGTKAAAATAPSVAVAAAAASAAAALPTRKKQKKTQQQQPPKSDIPFVLPQLPVPPPPPPKTPKQRRSMAVVDPGASGVALPPKTRRNSAQVNKELKRKRAEEDIVNEAMSVATRLYQAEQSKKKDERKSSEKIMEEVNKQYGTQISGATLRRYIRAGDIGTGRKTLGRPVTIVSDPRTNELCRQAYLTHIQLVMYKTKAKKVKLTYMCRKIQALLKLDVPKANRVVDRLRKETAMQHDKVIGAAEYDDVLRSNREACDALTAMGYDGNVMSTDDDSLLPYPKKKRRKKAGAALTAAATSEATAAPKAPQYAAAVGRTAAAVTEAAATTAAAGMADHSAFATAAIADPGFHHYYFPDGTAIARAGFL